jgi:hypothetical protein
MAVDLEERPAKMARKKVSSKSGGMPVQESLGHPEPAQVPVKRPLRIVMSSPKGGLARLGHAAIWPWPLRSKGSGWRPWISIRRSR